MAPTAKPQSPAFPVHSLPRPGARRPSGGLRGLAWAIGLAACVLGATVSAPATMDLDDLSDRATIDVDGEVCRLADAIAAANAGATVGGCTGSPGLDVLSLGADVTLSTVDPRSSRLGGAPAGLPDITSAVVIVAGDGSVIERSTALGCAVDSADAFRFFNVLAGGELYLFDLTLRSGCAAGARLERASGGAIHVAGGRLELSGVVFQANRAVAAGAQADGGAVACFNGEVPSLVETTFRFNTATGLEEVDGSAPATGGGLSLFGCPAGVMRDVTFLENTARGPSGDVGLADAGFGGGLLAAHSAMDLLEAVRFESNSAVGGSAIADRPGRGSGGGAFLTLSPVGAIRGCVFLGNRAEGGSSVNAQGGDAFGGGLRAEGAQGRPFEIMESCVFEDNQAIGGGGAAVSIPGIARGGGLHVDGAGAAIRNTLFTANLALAGAIPVGGSGPSAQGGGVYARLALEIEGGAWVENSARGVLGAESIAEGGGLWTSRALTLNNAHFDGNRAVGGDTPDPTGLAGDGLGGAVYATSDLDVRASTFARNRAFGGRSLDAVDGADGRGRGGALWVAGGDAATVVVASTLFDDNAVGVDPAVPLSEDCWDDIGGLVSLGFNLVEAPGTCTFVGPGDLLGPAAVFASTYPAADWGCVEVLGDGTCLPVIAIDERSPGADAGSCAVGSTAADARGVARPFELPAVPDAADGCDIGGFEAFDADGDGVTEASDCAPTDPSAGRVDRCGVCGGDDASCAVFLDGFESGDASGWSVVMP
ncbi:MAG: hypothetical protein AAGM22_23730 [Acidobacteriota bacterium]